MIGLFDIVITLAGAVAFIAFMMFIDGSISILGRDFDKADIEAIKKKGGTK